MLALRLAAFEHLVDLGRIDELRGIEPRRRVVADRRGHDPGHDRTVRRASPTAVPLLARATPLIGHFQIRNRGTIGGSLAHADPAAEYPAVALALDAELEVLSTAGPPDDPGRRVLHRALDHRASATTSCSPAVTVPRVVGPVRVRGARSSPAATATSPSPARPSPSSSTTTTASGAAASACSGLGSTPERAGDRRSGGASARPVDEIDADEVGRLAVADARVRAVGPPRVGGLPAPGRRRHGRRSAWRAAIEEARDG